MTGGIAICNTNIKEKIQRITKALEVDKISNFRYCLLNHHIARFDLICKKSGFKDQHVEKEDEMLKLLGVTIFPANKSLPLDWVLMQYILFIKRRLTRVDSPFYRKVKEILEDQSFSDIKEYFRAIKMEDLDSQIYCVLALSIFYFFLERQDIAIFIEKNMPSPNL